MSDGKSHSFSGTYFFKKYINHPEIKKLYNYLSSQRGDCLYQVFHDLGMFFIVNTNTDDLTHYRIRYPLKEGKFSLPSEKIDFGRVLDDLKEENDEKMSEFEIDLNQYVNDLFSNECVDMVTDILLDEDRKERTIFAPLNVNGANMSPESIMYEGTIFSPLKKNVNDVDTSDIGSHENKDLRTYYEGPITRNTDMRAVMSTRGVQGEFKEVTESKEYDEIKISLKNPDEGKHPAENCDYNPLIAYDDYYSSECVYDGKSADIIEKNIHSSVKEMTALYKDYSAFYEFFRDWKYSGKKLVYRDVCSVMKDNDCIFSFLSNNKVKSSGIRNDQTREESIDSIISRKYDITSVNEIELIPVYNENVVHPSEILRRIEKWKQTSSSKRPFDVVIPSFVYVFNIYSIGLPLINVVFSYQASQKYSSFVTFEDFSPDFCDNRIDYTRKIKWDFTTLRALSLENHFASAMLKIGLYTSKQISSCVIPILYYFIRNVPEDVLKIIANYITGDDKITFRE
jgi:hypothetical protein